MHEVRLTIGVIAPFAFAMCNARSYLGVAAIVSMGMIAVFFPWIGNLREGVQNFV